MKQIIFLAVDCGVDGRGPMAIRFASHSERIRDEWINTSPNKPWLSSVEQIHDLDIVAEEAWKRLNPIERLSLASTSCPIWQSTYEDNSFDDQERKS